tara:strand:+ start:207 stop:989 length:783 start_codon:yes stop_codon:yes gene_type:complete
MANLSMKNCPWLKDLPKEDRNTTASYYANLGELVHKNIKIATNEELFNPITDSINGLREWLMENLHKSSIKGQVGEGIVRNILEQQFTNCTVSDASKGIKTADIDFYDSENDKSYLVEVKNWSSAIKTAEVEKFRRDVIHNNRNGIFISLSSKICCKKMLDIEKIENNYIIYWSNMVTLENVPLSIYLMRHLLSDKVKEKLEIDEIISKVRELQTVIQENNKLNDLITNMQKNINEMQKLVISTDVKLQSTYKSIMNSFE